MEYRPDCCSIEEVETLIEPIREHRFVVRFQGAWLGEKVCDTDPLTAGMHPLAHKVE